MSAVIGWIGVFWLVLLAITLAIVGLSRRKSSLDRIAKSAGLPVTDDVRSMIVNARRIDITSTAIGSGAGILVAFLALAATRTTAPFEIFWAYFLVIMAGIALGAELAVVRTEHRRQDATVRFARARAVTRDAYESKLWQWSPRIGVGLLVVGFLARLLLTPNPTKDIPPFLFIYVAATVVLLITAELSVASVIGRGQPAGSALELAWDDAFKARAVNALTFLPPILGAYGGTVATALATPPVHMRGSGSPVRFAFLAGNHRLSFTGALTVEVLIAMIAILFMLAVVLVEYARGMQRRYLGRLWPEFEAERRERVAASSAQPPPVVVGGARPKSVADDHD